MNLWKLGCRWGSNTTLFYNFIKEKGIVVGWEDKTYQIGDWLLLTDGYTVLAFAQVSGTPMSCTVFPELKEEFLKFQLPFENGLILAKADFIELEKKDQFLYQLQQGIVRVHNNEIKKIFFKLLKKYINKMYITNHLEILLLKKQIILQGPPGTGKTRLAKELADELTSFDITEKDISLLIENEELKTLSNQSSFHIIEINNIKRFVRVKPSNSVNEYSITFDQITNCINNSGWNDTVEKWNTHGNASYLISISKKIMIRKIEEADKQVKLIQFHPSYTYEDFVRGIVAKPNPEGEGIIYEAENKTLGHFAKLALDNYLASQGIRNTNSDFDNRLKVLLEEVNNKIDSGETYKFADKSTAEIISVGSDYLIYSFPNRLDIRYKLLYCDIEKIFNKRTDIKIPIDLRDKEIELQLEMKGKYPYYFMILEKLNKISNLPSTNNKVEELKNYILIIDEINRANLSSVLGELIYALEYRGENVESIYDIKGEGNQLILPPNLYIIGTMNMSDRSVGHIDYAIRRRFAFVDVLPKVLEIEDFQVEAFKTISTLFISNLDAYLLDNNVVLEKSQHLSEEFSPKDVWLGHSYFISTNEDFDIRKKYEIKPILEEYVKDGILKKSAESIINGL